MKEFAPGNYEQGDDKEKLILTGLGLVESGKSEDATEIFYRFGSTEQLHKSEAKGPVTKMEDLMVHFQDVQVIEPDRICRPAGDTTLFTSAGVQHIETILREHGELKKEIFAVAQPVIRSQYMDKVKEGTSTAFVNFSVEALDTNLEEFNSLCQKMIDMFIDRGATPEDLKFKIETLPDKWGDRSFTKTVLTMYTNEIEVGEGVLMRDYPVTEETKIDIADICCGVERMNWALGGRYFQEFDGLYSDKTDDDTTASVIDCIRTSVLMVGEGVKPSHTDPGFRLRRLSKKFVERNKGVNLDTAELVGKSLEYWKGWGYKPDVSEQETLSLVEAENVRSYNNMVLLMVEKAGGPKINANINQPTNSLIEQLQISLPPKTKLIFSHVLEELGNKSV
jgi:hypothetical protein